MQGQNEPSNSTQSDTIEVSLLAKISRILEWNLIGPITNLGGSISLQA